MSGKVVVLTGGVGGAKLVLGLTRVMPSRDITAIVNTADDFRHLGLFVSPDVDTLLYTLSGKANPVQGWGREDESWSFMAALRSLGGEDWFQLGDGDLALHVLRTQALKAGSTLSEITGRFARAWDIEATIRPMSNETVRTMLTTDQGELAFQNYFVELRCEPAVQAVCFEGSQNARPAPGVIEAIGEADAILVAPSNPYLSIDPILAVRGIGDALRAATAPVIAVSPIIAGAAVKGPTAKLMQELGVEVSPAAIASHYEGLIDGLLMDERDRPTAIPIAQDFADILMSTIDDRARVAAAALKLASTISRS
jgi:LPPG:FO 2-phospho-L-lactate transferase